MTVLVGTDFSNASAAAARFGARLALAREMSMTLLYVAPDLGEGTFYRTLFDNPGEIEEEVRSQSSTDLEEWAEDALADVDLPQVDLTVRLGHPADEILSMADEELVEFVVCGTTGQSALRETLLGSTASRLVRERVGPVVIVPDHDSRPIRKILACVDMSGCSGGALRNAAQLADLFDAELIAMHAMYVPTIAGDDEGAPRLREAEIRDFIAEQQKKVENFTRELDLYEKIDRFEMVEGEPAQAIMETIEEFDPDLCCLGTHGRTGIERFLLGSVAEKIVRDAPRPTLTNRC